MAPAYHLGGVYIRDDCERQVPDMCHKTRQAYFGR